ncbi:MAG: hypothetical protein ACKOPU_03370 [Candidatus Planktophila sp.]
MGLDMYLTGKRYLSKYFNEGDEAVAEAIAEKFPELKGKGGRFGDASCVKEVQIEAGYWRKANAIHDWFVKNVQGGEDECRPHYVAREQLEELKELCQEVLANRERAAELLPTASGFFFGGTDYDEWYFQDIESTIQIIDDCLALPASWEFEYRSSW